MCYESTDYSQHVKEGFICNDLDICNNNDLRINDVLVFHHYNVTIY